MVVRKNRITFYPSRQKKMNGQSGIFAGIEEPGRKFSLFVYFGKVATFVVFVTGPKGKVQKRAFLRP